MDAVLSTFQKMSSVQYFLWLQYLIGTTRDKITVSWRGLLIAHASTTAFFPMLYKISKWIHYRLVVSSLVHVKVCGSNFTKV